MNAPRWIDTHCHLDAEEFAADRQATRACAAINCVALLVLPAVCPDHFERVRALAHANGDAYALGIHPLYVEQAGSDAIRSLETALVRWCDDPRLVAVGEIGLDYWDSCLSREPWRSSQRALLQAQLRLARRFDLPVLLHTRRALDDVLAALRQVAPEQSWRGIAHAYTGSDQQTRATLELGLKLGFGGAFTHERATRLRELASRVPQEAIVLETDAPDMVPRWLYRIAADRTSGMPQARNEPAQLARIGTELAALRGVAPAALAHACWNNSLDALPRLKSLAIMAP